MTLTPSSNLTPSTNYTVDLSGAKDTAGNQMDQVTWTFTTAASGNGCPCTIWPNSTVPGTSAAQRLVGSRARRQVPRQPGWLHHRDPVLQGQRQHRHAHRLAVEQDRQHKLATVTFTGESATGWQQATFSAPVPVTANTTYVASYYAPVGRYAVNTNYFASSATTRGPLTALRNGTDGGNGVYKYGASGFPNSTYQSSNYWVDVVFDTTANDTTAPTVVAKMPASDSSGVAVSTAVSATFSEAVASSSVAMELRDPDNSLVPRNHRVQPGYPDRDSHAECRPCGLDDVHGEGERRTGCAGQHHDTGHLVIHDGRAASAATGPGTGRPDRAGHLKLEPVLQVPSRDPADRGSQRVQDDRCQHALGIDSGRLRRCGAWQRRRDRGPGQHADHLGQWRRQPDRNEARQRLCPVCLGITSASGTTDDGYLKVDPATAPGAGIVSDTIQYHGTADHYSLSGAQAIATIYSNATTPTDLPGRHAARCRNQRRSGRGIHL